MARELKKISLKIVTDGDGNPQSASVDYEVHDGAARKTDTYVVPTPDWDKVMHNMGAAGEFWKDVMAAIKTQEGI